MTCICDLLTVSPFSPPISPLFSLLVHRHELFKPSSTSNIIKRSLPFVTVIDYDPVSAPKCALDDGHSGDGGGEVASKTRTGRTFLMHPAGPPLDVDRDCKEGDAVVFIDGTWSQAARIKSKLMENKERAFELRSLPLLDRPASSFGLRTQSSEMNFSTGEAVAHLLAALGDKDNADFLSKALELHTLAGLAGRCKKVDAERMLESSKFIPMTHPVVARLKLFKKKGKDDVVDGDVENY
jgi:DTW domain-containing protein YfiP